MHLTLPCSGATVCSPLSPEGLLCTAVTVMRLSALCAVAGRRRRPSDTQSGDHCWTVRPTVDLDAESVRASSLLCASCSAPVAVDGACLPTMSHSAWSRSDARLTIAVSPSQLLHRFRSRQAGSVTSSLLPKSAAIWLQGVLAG